MLGNIRYCAYIITCIEFWNRSRHFCLLRVARIENMFAVMICDQFCPSNRNKMLTREQQEMVRVYASSSLPSGRTRAYQTQYEYIYICLHTVSIRVVTRPDWLRVRYVRRPRHTSTHPTGKLIQTERFQKWFYVLFIIGHGRLGLKSIPPLSFVDDGVHDATISFFFFCAVAALLLRQHANFLCCLIRTYSDARWFG